VHDADPVAVLQRVKHAGRHVQGEVDDERPRVAEDVAERAASMYSITMYCSETTPPPSR
jgi:hypothetical protein